MILNSFSYNLTSSFKNDKTDMTNRSDKSLSSDNDKSATTR
jgi:hypothetical protein